MMTYGLKLGIQSLDERDHVGDAISIGGLAHRDTVGIRLHEGKLLSVESKGGYLAIYMVWIEHLDAFTHSWQGINDWSI